MTIMWLKLNGVFIQKTMTKTKLKIAAKINTVCLMYTVECIYIAHNLIFAIIAIAM